MIGSLASTVTCERCHKTVSADGPAPTGGPLAEGWFRLQQHQGREDTRYALTDNGLIRRPGVGAVMAGYWVFCSVRCLQGALHDREIV